MFNASSGRWSFSKWSFGHAWPLGGVGSSFADDVEGSNVESLAGGPESEEKIEEHRRITQ